MANYRVQGWILAVSVALATIATTEGILIWKYMRTASEATRLAAVEIQRSYVSDRPIVR